MFAITIMPMIVLMTGMLVVINVIMLMMIIIGIEIGIIVVADDGSALGKSIASGNHGCACTRP